MFTKKELDVLIKAVALFRKQAEQFAGDCLNPHEMTDLTAVKDAFYDGLLKKLHQEKSYHEGEDAYGSSSIS